MEAMARDLDDEPAEAVAAVPVGIRVIRDVAYGADKRQKFDVYLPATNADSAPVIFMVHGGGWRMGDKAARSVVENKMRRWVPKGYAFVSVNYRMLPDADPARQAEDVALALAVAQDKAASWGADRRRFILMGHSAGAHLVAMLESSPKLQAKASPWLGAVLLDSGALDVPLIMGNRHARLYDEAFGSDPAYWRQVSPLHLLQSAPPPLLAVCSSRRAFSCNEAQAFVAKAKGFGGWASALPEDMSHRDINVQLGTDGAYTEAVERFMAGLDPVVAARLR
jgi:acetyl esterase/lipase